MGGPVCDWALLGETAESRNENLLVVGYHYSSEILDFSFGDLSLHESYKLTLIKQATRMCFSVISSFN